MTPDPRPPSGDPLAAEIAAHRPRHTARDVTCYECNDDWPCLVRRLADERAALLAVISRLDGHPTPVDPLGRCWFCGGGLGHGPHGHEPACAWAAMRALAPADGEG